MDHLIRNAHKHRRSGIALVVQDIDCVHRTLDELHAGLCSQLSTDISNSTRDVAFPVHSPSQCKSFDPDGRSLHDQSDDPKSDFGRYGEESARVLCMLSDFLGSSYSRQASLHLHLPGKRHQR